MIFVNGTVYKDTVEVTLTPEEKKTLSEATGIIRNLIGIMEDYNSSPCDSYTILATDSFFDGDDVKMQALDDIRYLLEAISTSDRLEFVV